MKRAFSLALIAAPLFLLGSMAPAQETTGDVLGRLTSANEGAVRGATVVATSPSMLGARTTRSASDGVFRLRALPPGTYTLRIRSPGFREVVIDSVHVELGRSAGLPVVLMERTVTELSALRIEAPQTTLDPTRTTIGATIDAKDYAALPSARDYKTLMTILPHVNTSYHGDGVTVGGSTGLENAYFIDGTNVTAPIDGFSGISLPYNFVRTVEVRTGGYEAQYGKALGAIVNAVTYSGTNEFESNIFGFATSDHLAAAPVAPPTLRTTGSYQFDVGARISGPVVRDQLWFSAAYNPRVDAADKVLGSLGTFTERQTAHLFAGKLTWQPRASTNVEVSVFGDPTTGDQVRLWDFLSAQTPLNAAPYLARLASGGVSGGARAVSVIGPAGLLEVNLSRSTFSNRLEAQTSEGLEPLMIDYVANTVEGGMPFTRTNEQSRMAFTIRASVELARHSVVAGFEYEDNRNLYGFDNPGLGVIFRDDSSVYLAIDQHVNDRVRSRVPTVYVQDSWRIGTDLTLNIGTRWSAQWLEGDPGRVAQRFPDEWQPRIGFNWRLGAAGQDRMFGSYGRFFVQEPLNLASLYYVDYHWSEKPFNVDPRLPGATPLDSVGGKDTQDAFPPVDGVEVENFDEFTLGYERLVGKASRLTVRLLHRTLRSSFQQGIDSSGRFLVGTPGKGELSFMPGPVRTHAALEVSIQGHVSRLQYRASYVLSRTRGNYSGLFSSDTHNANPGNNTGFSAFYQAENSYGPLPNDAPHVLKLVATYQPAAALSFGAVFAAMSGAPLNRLGAGPAGFPRFLAPRGSIGRMESNWDLSLRSTWTTRLGSSPARFILDVLHVGNPQAAIRIDQTRFFSENQYGNQSNPNPRYLMPVAFQPPMMARIGIEIDR